MAGLDPRHIAIRPLDQDFAKKHLARLYELLQLIPDVRYRPEDLLAVVKPDGRDMHAKWQHSFAALDGDKLVGFVMAFERAAEANEWYPTNSLYISELAVDPAYQRHGVGHHLVTTLLEQVKVQGWRELTGPVVFSTQTNAADWNAPVRDFYESFGFQVIGQKQYDNRTDLVFRCMLTEIKL